MAEQETPPGRLVAIDGSRGNDVTKAAEALAAQLREHGRVCAISRWDASGLFGELAQADRADQQVSPRTLALVYAADLAFRLRWEIRPVLLAGGVVIAAPYLETAVTFGTACGLPEHWLRDLLRFVPEPQVRCLARERKADRGWKRRLGRGYAEYGSALLHDSTAGGFASKRTRQAMMAALERARGRKVFDLSGKGAAAAVKVITGSRPAASAPSPSRPRTARR